MRSALLVLGFLVTFGVQSAAAQSSAKLDFTWSPNGSLEATVTHNTRPAKGCVFRLRAVVSGERQKRFDHVGPVVTRQVGKSKRLARVQRVKVTGLPGVGRFSTGDPVLTLQSKTTCGKKEVVSNAVARFVKCGRNVPRVKATEFLATLKRRAK